MGDPRELPPMLSSPGEPTPPGRPSFLPGAHFMGGGGGGAPFNPPPSGPPPSSAPPEPAMGSGGAGGGGPVYDANIPPGPSSMPGAKLPEPVGSRIPKSQQTADNVGMWGGVDPVTDFMMPRTPTIADYQRERAPPPPQPQQSRHPYPHHPPAHARFPTHAESDFKKYLPYIAVALLLGAGAYYYYTTTKKNNSISSGHRSRYFGR